MSTERHCKKRNQWVWMFFVLAALYGSSFGFYLFLLRPDMTGWMAAVAVSASILACAAIVLFYSAAPAGKRNEPGQPSDVELPRLRVLWWISIVGVLVACADLAQSAYLSALVHDQITLTTIRDDFFETDGYRSLLGRISGLLFVPFAIISSIRFRINGKPTLLIGAFAVAAFYSLLMGGRGQIIFFALAAVPALLQRLSIARVAFVVSGLVLLLGLIYSLRTTDVPDGGGLTSIAQYLSTPWFGLDLLLTDYQGKYQLDWLRLGPPFLLESLAFPIFDSKGNLYGGVGHLVHNFGIVGAPLYLVAITCLFLVALKIYARAYLARMYIQHSAFLYFSFLLFHDLTIFYPSFLFSLLLLPFLGAAPAKVFRLVKQDKRVAP